MPANYDTVVDSAQPRLCAHVRLRFDQHRDRWMLLLPERVLMPDATAVEILQLCDGAHSLNDIITTLSERYEADQSVIGTDVRNLLAQLASKGVITS